MVKKLMLLHLCLIAVLLTLAGDENQRRPYQMYPVKRASGAMAALQFFTAARAFPDADIPDKGYSEAFEYSKRALKKIHHSYSEASQWKNLGPCNVGGRTKAIAINPVHPNTIYIGAASGGLWRSHTGGAGKRAWEYIETGLPVLGISAIAIDPADTNVIYIGTGEVYGYQNAMGGFTIRTTRGSYGIGILKSKDAGETWSKSLDWSDRQSNGVQQICIHKLNSSLLYAATTEGAFKSMDAGQTWTRVHNVLMAMDVDINPINPDIVYVCCGDLGSIGAGVYRTLDGGKNWQLLKNGLLWDYTGKATLDLFPGDPNIIYVHLANAFNTVGIFCSRDGGDTWERVSKVDIAQYQGWYSQFVAVHPQNPEIVFAGGIDLWKSENGGKNMIKISDWRAYFQGTVPTGSPEGEPIFSHADHHAIAFHPGNPNIIYFVNDGGVSCTRDGGKTFTSLNGSYVTSQFYNGFSCATSDSQFAMGGTQDNGTLIYEGTIDWRRSAGGDGCWTAIPQKNMDTLYASYQYLSILKSTDRGQTWINSISGINTKEKAGFVAPFLLHPTSEKILYAGTDRVYKSIDGGGAWTSTTGAFALSGDAILSMAASATCADCVTVATAPNYMRALVFRTIDGGLSWEHITMGQNGVTLPNRYPMDIAVDPTNSKNIYIVYSGFGTYHLFKSNDAGLSWFNMGEDLPDVPSSAVAIDPLFPHHIYFGNDLGVYASTDGGVTWSEWSEGMPPTLIMDLTISLTNRAIRAVSHGNGVWERKLIGKQIVSVEKSETATLSFHLYQNYPNPLLSSMGSQVSSSTRIQFELSGSQYVSLKVYNTLGQEVTVLADGMMGSGRHVVTFKGEGLPAGIYFYRLQVGAEQQTNKMLLLTVDRSSR